MAMPMPKVGRYDFQSFRLVKMLLTETVYTSQNVGLCTARTSLDLSRIRMSNLRLYKTN